MRLYLDTGAMAALSVRRDPGHAAAVEFVKANAADLRLVTTNVTFAETVTLISARYGPGKAVEFGERFFASDAFDDVVYSDEFLERAALAVMKGYRDKRLSFADATAIALVKIEGLDGVFGFDQDFTRCGIPLYPRPAA